MKPNDPPPRRDRPAEAERATARQAIREEIRYLSERLADLARVAEVVLGDDARGSQPGTPVTPIRPDGDDGE